MSNEYHIELENEGEDMFAVAGAPIAMEGRLVQQAGGDATAPAETLGAVKSKRRVATTRAVYSDEFIARVMAQDTPRMATAPAALFGVVEAAPTQEISAKDLVGMLAKTATPAKSIDQAFGHADGQLQAWLVGGMTTFQDVEVGTAVAIVYHTKVAKLENLRGEDREALIRLIKKMCDTISAIPS